MNDYFTCIVLNHLKSLKFLIGLKEASKASSGKYVIPIVITIFMQT